MNKLDWVMAERSMQMILLELKTRNKRLMRSVSELTLLVQELIRENHDFKEKLSQDEARRIATSIMYNKVNKE